jgi:tetratricopeptide (TPR) repeat protein
LISKESSITFLAIIPLTVYFFTKEKPLSIFFRMIYFLLPIFIFFIMRDRAIGQYIHLNETSIVDNLLVGAPNKIVYYATAIKILGLYLLKLIIPYPLACDYSYNQIKMVGFDNFSFILSFIIHAFLTIYALITFKKKNIYSYFIIAYLISMSIYSNLIILIGSSFGERFLFAPSLFYSVFLSFIIFKLVRVPNNLVSFTSSQRLRLFALLLPILLFYSFITYSRNKDWKSSLNLYEADIRKSPESAHMNYYYGLEVMKEKAMKNGQVVKPEYLDTAIYYFLRARNIVPTFSDAYDQLGLAYFRKNEWDKALAYYDTCLKLSPTKAITYSNMGVIFFNRKQYDKALEAYENAVKYNPKFSDAWMNLGSTYGTLGRFNEAIAACKKCIEFNPQNAMAHYFLGITYQNIGDKQNADYYLNIAYQLNPSLKK